MKVLIVEDESPAARRLKQLLKTANEEIEIVATLEGVAHTLAWMSEHPLPDLIFMDIQLADGLSFEIFTHRAITCPVIFTTAYDEYALRAFKVNSIDYLLKPISQDDLNQSIEKYRALKEQFNGVQAANSPKTVANFEALLETLQFGKNYKSRLLIKIGEKMISILMENIAYFFSEDKLVYAITSDAKRYPLDYSLDELESMIDPKTFFRLNRQYIAKINAIQSIHNYFNGKLKLFLLPPTQKEVVVSREKASHFKQWLEV